MKIILLITTLTCLVELSFSQTKCFYINQTTRLAYSITDSIPYTGLCQDYYKTGKLKNECVFRNGFLVLTKRFYENGQIKDSTFYLNTDNGAYESGGSCEYYTWWNNGYLKENYKFVDNKQDGSYNYYYDNGNKKVEGQCKMAKPFGIIKYYYPNGLIKHEYYYRNDSIIYSNHWNKNGVKREK